MIVSEAYQHLIHEVGPNQGGEDVVAIALVTPQLVNLPAKILFRLADGDLVNTFDILSLAPATRFLTVALNRRSRTNPSKRVKVARGERGVGMKLGRGEEGSGGGDRERLGQAATVRIPIDPVHGTWYTVVIRRGPFSSYPSFLLTFARFLRHSVQALGVTTPRPLLRFDMPGAF